MTEQCTLANIGHSRKARRALTHLPTFTMTIRPTWKPYDAAGKLPSRDALPNSVFAFPKERKEPLTDAAHVRSAIARFDQVEGVSRRERDVALANIQKAANYYGVRLAKVK